MNKYDGETLKRSFVRQMQARILSGELKPGDKLPPERELAADMGISRGSVNQGMLDLERMGFLRIVPRKGTFVADYAASSNPDTLSVIMSYDSALIDPALFRDLMDMRTLVERESVRLVCLRAGAAETEALNGFINRIFSSGTEDISDTLFAFHYSLTVFSGNKAYSLLFKSFEKMIRRLIELHYSEQGELMRALPLYNELCSAISRHNAEESDRLIMSILGSAADCLNRLL